MMGLIKVLPAPTRLTVSLALPCPDFDWQPAANTANPASAIQNNRDCNFILPLSSHQHPPGPAPKLLMQVRLRVYGCNLEEADYGVVNIRLKNGYKPRGRFPTLGIYVQFVNTGPGQG